MILPWQTQQWQQLCYAKQQQSLPHALLLAGAAGMGKAQFADTFLRSLLCQQVQTNNESTVSTDCGTCHACRLTAGKVHPNVLWIEPEEAGHAIKIDVIREVIEFIQQSALQGGHRIVVINHADYLNHNAANALLKTLEEPSSGAIIILISHQSDRLPATIRSRCQRMTFTRPSTQEALAWLKTQLPDTAMDMELLLSLADGAPLAALQLAQDETLISRQEWLNALSGVSQKQVDPLQVAAKLQSIEPIRLLDFTLSWLLDLLRLHAQVDAASIDNKDHQQTLCALQKTTDRQRTSQLMVYTQQLRNKICLGVNFNKQLMLENILVRWLECCTSKDKTCQKHYF